MKKNRKKKKQTPVIKYALIDIFLIGLSLVVFALFHHVLDFGTEQGLGIVNERPTMVITASPTPHATQTAEPTSTPDADIDVVTSTSGDDSEFPDPVETVSAAPTPEVTDAPEEIPETQDADNRIGVVGYFGGKFDDKFTDGEVIANENGYKSANINVTLTTYNEEGTEFFVADIYVKDITCFRTGFAYDRYGKSASQWPKDIAKRMNAVVAISGDYYGLRTSGNIIRNGVLYRTDANPPRDTCVLYWDGTMETYPAGKFDAAEQMSMGAYQTWTFGPQLLDQNGKAITQFKEDHDIQKKNPRSVIGYFEPGHYCFVTVEGRIQRSIGLNLKNTALLMEKLGCVRAYNLDGGATAQMVYGNKLVNKPSGGGRPSTDILAIIDEIQ